MLDLVESALLFASEAHKNQKMFEPDIPYISHSMAVALDVLSAYKEGEEQFDLNFAIVVALLHDTIEDTNVTYQDIESTFGKKIADGVLALTKNKELPYYEQMEDCIKRIQKCDKEIAIVKLADRVFNLRKKPFVWNDEKAQSYALEAEYILKELGYASKYLRHKLKKRINEYLQ